ncbi:carboxymuconolactone decarboxylase family protein [Pelagibacterales bacterium]|jgi:4-carboxymuconolactone decarboxylase|nr:carboxymuconolactone decarboxylase family protein [Pelagibacterales bacterium]MBL6861952.1 carboxymuconolactone decarboxylase family protein [Pelagibacterales bacterium]MDA9897154.1 carboxymuconolactone decarboxylase family protein [Pelagibacterales bacterium]MDB9817812.1 carboxymuconolactone decarboxylase family protein [Pelagibacterales bacterium]MDB9955153.1 carboxymuconolactone decarboxylase family protein [Pelagibacterales bacterium]|tara:strand:- start:627 stop:1010 length:384 start_codon:yes stop_codon:yes gene_type:complete
MTYKIDKESREKGLKILKKMDLLQNSATPISKDFMAHIVDALYGNIWSRDELISLPERSLITVAVLVALNRENELKIHLRGALNLGVSKEKIEEMILHVAHYSGFPTGVSANQILNDICAEIDKESK